MNRLVIVPDEAHETFGAALKPRLANLAREIDANNLGNLLSPQTTAWLEGTALNSPGALLLWAPEGKDYSVAWSEDGIVTNLRERARADAGLGLVAQVFDSGRSAAQTEEELDTAEWTNLESLLGQAVSSMSASPVNVFGNCSAVVTLVAFTEYEEPMRPPTEAAALLARLIEDRILRMSLGLETV